MWRGTIAIVALLALGLPGTSGAEDAPLVNWPGLLPGLTRDHTPNAFDDCADGSPACVAGTLEEMYAREHELIYERDCDHNAVFARTYIIVTEAYADAAVRQTPDGPVHSDYFDEPDYLAREDRTFALMYFRARDDWEAGLRDRVPRAWQIAFESADNRELTAIGNMLQGINGHVNRDMPYLLAGLGLVKPDGTSRRADHNRMNELLNRVFDDTIATIAQKFDPFVANFDQDATVLDNFLFFQLLPAWREQVWRHAEMLVSAPDEASRQLVGSWIETYAAQQASLIRAGARLLPYGGDPSVRDAHCRAFHGLG